MYDRCVIKSKAFANTSATHTTTSSSSYFTRHYSTRQLRRRCHFGCPMRILWFYFHTCCLPSKLIESLWTPPPQFLSVLSVAIRECDLQMSCDKKFTFKWIKENQSSRGDLLGTFYSQIVPLFIIFNLVQAGTVVVHKKWNWFEHFPLQELSGCGSNRPAELNMITHRRNRWCALVGSSGSKATKWDSWPSRWTIIVTITSGPQQHCGDGPACRGDRETCWGVVVSSS